MRMECEVELDSAKGFERDQGISHVIGQEANLKLMFLGLNKLEALLSKFLKSLLSSFLDDWI